MIAEKELYERYQKIKDLTPMQRIIIFSYLDTFETMNSMTLEQLKELFPILKGAWFYEKFKINWKWVSTGIQNKHREKVVNGRELWTILKSKRQFSDWINGRIEDCGAVEKEDFQTF